MVVILMLPTHTTLSYLGLYTGTISTTTHTHTLLQYTHSVFNSTIYNTYMYICGDLLFLEYCVTFFKFLFVLLNAQLVYDDCLLSLTVSGNAPVANQTCLSNNLSICYCIMQFPSLMYTCIHVHVYTQR